MPDFLTNAWFSVDLDTAGGSLKYVYVFAKGKAAAPLPPAAAAPATDGPWRFKEVRVFTRLDNARVVKATHDTSGGQVDLEVSGKAYQLCPDGAEQLRLVWKFDRAVDALSNGQKVSPTLDASLITRSGGCTGGLGSRTVFSFGGSNGQVNPFDEKETAIIDGSRLWPSTAGRISVTKEPQRVASTGVSVDTRPFGEGRTRAWFSLDIDSPGGSVKYVYLFERAGK